MAKILQAQALSNTAISSAVTRFAPLGDGWTDFSVAFVATETFSRTFYRSAGTSSNLRCFVSANTRNGSTTIRIRKNLANGNQLLTIPSSTTGSFEDVVNTDAIVSGDALNLQCVVGGTSGSITIRSVRSHFDATTNSVSRHTCGASAGSTAAATYFMPIGGRRDGNNTIEAYAETYFGSAGTLKNLFLNIETNSRNGTSTFKTRKNGANGNLTIDVPATTTGTFEDTVNSDTVLQGDLFCFQNTHGGSSGTLIPNIQSVEFETSNGSTLHCYGRPNAGHGQGAGISSNIPISGEVISPQGSVSNVQIQPGIASNLTRLSAYIQSNTVGDPPDDSFIRLQINGSNSLMFLTIPGGGSGRYTDITNTEQINTTDLISYFIFVGSGDGLGSMNFRNFSLTDQNQAAVAQAAQTILEAICSRGLDQSMERRSDFSTERKDLITYLKTETDDAPG